MRCVTAIGVVLFAFAAENPAAENVTSTESPSVRPTLAEMAAQMAVLQGRVRAVVAFRNVSIIAATEADTLAQGMTIVVDGERIAAITPTESDSAVLPENAEIVAATGWFVTPGLIDSHVHLATLPHRQIAEQHLRRYVYGGITTVRDMAGDVRALADLSRAALINEIKSPDIKYSALMAGRSFFADPRTITSGLGARPGDLPWMQAIDEHTDIALAVAQARGTWATGVKVYANLPGDRVRAIIAEGRRQGIPVWTHLKVYPASPFDAVGAHSVSHACMFAQHQAERAADTDSGNGESSAPGEITEFDAASPEFQRYVRELADSGTMLDATVAMNTRYRELASAPRDTGYGGPADNPEPASPPAATGFCNEERVLWPMLSAMHAGGVRMVAGTDFSANADDPFPALFVEMAALARVPGITNMDALRAATANAAEALGLADDIGTVEMGKYANLAFYTRNPLESMDNLRSLALTMKRGHRYFRSDYHHRTIPDLPFPGEPPASGEPPEGSAGR